MPIHGYPGNVITANPTAPTSSVATGVWTTEQQLQAVSQGNWPGYEYPISRSLRFNSADSAYLNRTPGSAGNRRTWTWSGWVKRGDTANNSGSGASTELTIFGSGTNVNAGNGVCSLGITGGVNFQVWQYLAGTVWNVVTTQVFRDYSAWYHILIAVDTTQATSSNRVKMYVNGVQVTAFGTASYPSQNYDTGINSTDAHNIGRRPDGQNYWGGYLTENYLIDGQALEPSSFGLNDPDTGVWSPKRYTGAYGTNGFYLNFSDNSGTTSTTLGKDSSGNGNNWTPNNFSVTAGSGNDSLVDSPTAYGTDTGVGGEVRGNYATLNPLINPSADTFSNGNLQVVTSSSNYGTSVSSIAIPTTGKWYAECTIVATATYPAVGICSTSSVFTATSWVGSFTGVTYYGKTGNKFVNATGSSYGATYGANDVIGIAYDADNLQITFYKNNTTQGTITGVTAGTYYFGGSEWDPASGTQVWNFGQRAFAYTAPSGFKALCTQNLPTPTIGATSTTQANDYFDATTFTGNASTNTIVNSGSMQPDMVWLKSRSNANNHTLYDAVRGVNIQLYPNLTNAEDSGTGLLTSFNSNGFTLGASQNSNDNNGESSVGWQWRASNATAVTNTAGTITSTVSANTTSGFSIVTYSGTGSNATVGHGLGVAPSMVIVMCRGGGNYFPVYHVTYGAGKTMWLQITDAATTDSAYWQGVSPTTSVFSIGTNSNTNSSTKTYVAYCFAPVAGYSAFGSYTGNGSTDGPFVYLGFRPEFVMIKRTDSANEWLMHDSARSPYNVVNARLSAQSSAAESTSPDALDFTSNGFKLRTTDTGWNASGGTYIYMAFAESPFKYSLAR